MDIDILKAADMLRGMNDVGVLVHANPDGDCLGSGYALCLIMRSIGKRARVLCSDVPGKKFTDIFSVHDTEQFEPASYVSVDVAAPSLLGKYDALAEKVSLCVDHHATNSRYALASLVEPEAAATAELIYLIGKELGTDITEDIATALYIGILTDTGCFQFSNTTPRTHIIAAELIKKVKDFAELNRVFFAVKSKQRLMLECSVAENMRYYCGDRIAVIAVSRKLREETGLPESELDGLAPIPCRVEGVEIGVTIREKEDGTWRASVRTATYADASAICAAFGGGGHIRAAGCTLSGDMLAAEKSIVAQCERELNRTK